MTTYNGHRYVGLQLQSMADQTRLPDEIVIGDDQSTDATSDVVAEFAARHPRISVRYERNSERLGSTLNFESVVRRCSGDVVVFSDQDDVWKPNRIARMLEVFDNNPYVAYVFSNGELIDEKGSVLVGTLFDSVDFTAEERRRYQNGEAMDILLRHNVITGAALAVRRAYLIKVLPFQTDWWHDYYLAFLLEVNGGGVVLDEPLIQYRCHGSQQVGVAASGGFKKMLAYARKQNEAYCHQDVVNFRTLRKRLDALDLVSSAFLADLDDKIAFFETRTLMRSDPFMAPILLWHGWRSGNYVRYTLGIKQLIVDMVAAFLAALGQRHRKSN